MEWIEANAGWLWLVLAAGLAGVELLTLDLVFLMIAAGAGAAGVVALVGGPLALQLAAFAAVALLMLAAVRPVA
ncbi:NfeD family protein, partial [Micrococcus luteus]|nr:NfeD family protein [Micrococcus luteus]